ncbi:hypothetical protein [Achromobacter marplatensis]
MHDPQHQFLLLAQPSPIVVRDRRHGPLKMDLALNGEQQRLLRLGERRRCGAEQPEQRKEE